MIIFRDISGGVSSCLKITKNKHSIFKFAGVDSGEATPDSIPNSEVKLSCGDGIARVTVWESSATPALFYDPSKKTYWGFFLSEKSSMGISLESPSSEILLPSLKIETWKTS